MATETFVQTMQLPRGSLVFSVQDELFCVRLIPPTAIYAIHTDAGTGTDAKYVLHVDSKGAPATTQRGICGHVGSYRVGRPANRTR